MKACLQSDRQMTTASVGNSHSAGFEAPVRLSLLRSFDLRLGDDTVRIPPSARRVLAFLALNGRPLHRVFVAGQIWTESSQDHANACLRTTLWRLRQPGLRLVDARGSELWLAPNVPVDIDDVAERAHRVLDHRVERDDLARLSSAGDLLPDWYDDWLIVERERFRQLRLLALEALCEELTEAGRYPFAVEAGLAAVAGEPLRESAHRALMKAHLAAGNPVEALNQYRLFRQLIRKEAGLGPSAAMHALTNGLGCPQ
jgi:DNA-binding SARP family transcriptional activator